MKSKKNIARCLVGVGLGGLLSTSANASECTFTTEQDRLLKLAASYGEPFSYRKTLPAIVMQESFVGSYVVRINPNDGKHGSYGLTHILLETGMWLEGVDNIWKAKSEMVDRLMSDDLYSFKLAVKKLDSVHKGDWMETWKRYNGSVEYAYKIRDNIRLLERCGYFKFK